MDGYLLGILWGCCAIHHSSLICRHKDRYYPDYAASMLGGHVRVQYSRTGSQYTVNLPVRYDFLKKYGWSQRNADIRTYPITDDDIGFCSAWIELHHSFDMAKHKDGKRYPRLRIYGNYALISEIEPRISQIANVGRKSIGSIPINFGKTSAIYYQSASEIIKIRDTFIRNANVREKIDINCYAITEKKDGHGR